MIRTLINNFVNTSFPLTEKKTFNSLLGFSSRIYDKNKTVTRQETYIQYLPKPCDHVESNLGPTKVQISQADEFLAYTGPLRNENLRSFDEVEN